MATNIPIWPGSSSFCPGETPFGFYDYDYEFQIDADKVSDWCAKRLGYPINDIELQDIQFYACFEEAVTEYGAQLNAYNIRDNMLGLIGGNTGSNLTGKQVIPSFGGIFSLASSYGAEAGSGGNITYYTGSVTMTRGKQIYDLTDPNVVKLERGDLGFDNIEIKRIYHEAPPALVRFFDPFIGTGIGTQQMLDAFGFGSYSPGVSFMMMPIYADMLRLQAIEFNDTVRRSAYSFDISRDRLRIFPIPDGQNVTKVHFDYILKSERATGTSAVITGTISDFSNVPYENIVYEYVNSVGRRWIYRYTLALAKELLGYVRSKYSSIPIPNADITLNGSELVANGQTEKEALIAELREVLDTMSRQAQLERKQAEADALASQLSKVPMKIYIG
jgi:hypothetical protein